MLEVPEKERDWWNLLSTQSPMSISWKASLDRKRSTYKEYLATNGGLRECVRQLAIWADEKPIPEGFWDGLNEIHPRALMFLAKYGVEYTPALWEEPPAVEPIKGGCFGNAYVLQTMWNKKLRTEKSDLRVDYVEGIAFGRTEPVLHAWNAGQDKARAIDSTWYAAVGWTFYLGLPLRQHSYTRLRKLGYPNGKFHLLLRKDVFERVEEPLARIFSRKKCFANIPPS